LQELFDGVLVVHSACISTDLKRSSDGHFKKERKNMSDKILPAEKENKYI